MAGGFDSCHSAIRIIDSHIAPAFDGADALSPPSGCGLMLALITYIFTKNIAQKGSAV